MSTAIEEVTGKCTNAHNTVLNVFATSSNKNVCPKKLPTWAAGKADKRSALHWDAAQTIANFKVNGNTALAIIDSGSYKTIMDISMAHMLGLKVHQASGGDCGTYSVPGTG